MTDISYNIMMLGTDSMTHASYNVIMDTVSQQYIELNSVLYNMHNDDNSQIFLFSYLDAPKCLPSNNNNIKAPLTITLIK